MTVIDKIRDAVKDFGNVEFSAYDFNHLGITNIHTLLWNMSQRGELHRRGKKQHPDTKKTVTFYRVKELGCGKVSMQPCDKLAPWANVFPEFFSVSLLQKFAGEVSRSKRVVELE